MPLMNFKLIYLKCAHGPQHRTVRGYVGAAVPRLRVQSKKGNIAREREELSVTAHVYHAVQGGVDMAAASKAVRCGASSRCTRMHLVKLYLGLVQTS